MELVAKRLCAFRIAVRIDATRRCLITDKDRIAQSCVRHELKGERDGERHSVVCSWASLSRFDDDRGTSRSRVDRPSHGDGSACWAGRLGGSGDERGAAGLAHYAVLAVQRLVQQDVELGPLLGAQRRQDLVLDRDHSALGRLQR